LYLEKQYKIENLDKANRCNSSYLPTISWYISIARFIENGSDALVLIAEMKEAVAGIEFENKRSERLQRIYNELIPIAPAELKKGKSAIFEEGLSIS